MANDSINAEVALLKKNQQLANDLSTKDQDLAKTRQNLDTVNSDLNSTKQNLDATKNDLSAASASVQVQKAMENARKQFSADEAEAYQQGSNLLIRLKKVNFASGRSELPGTSLPVLAKVSEVAKSLNASEIKVEGHTDSIGSAGQNKTISEQRATAVATYFKSNGFNNIDVEAEGYGFEKPIATNKSKEGRAQNRRVDIIITPESVNK
jgi:outer membrane protein OmpA-like peptidoglycan-associated protein